MPPRPRKGVAAISPETVQSLSRSTLISAWTEAYGRPPPSGISRRLLEYAAAYNAQVKLYGGLSRETKRKLYQALEPGAASKAQPKTEVRSKLPSGSRLVREWKGQVHTVDVTEKGFIYRNRRYASLSEVARLITGTRWSGPRFFGL